MIANLALVSFYMAAAVVTLMQLVRTKERRLIPLMALFALAAGGHERGAWDGWGLLLHLLAGGAGLVLLVMLLPRHVPSAPAAQPRR